MRKLTNQTILNARSNPDDIVCINPAENRRYTRVEDIQRTIEKHGYWAGRQDIVLMNRYHDCPTCGGSGQINNQEAIYAMSDGSLLGPVELLTPEERKWALAEAAKLVAVSKTHPAMGWLLYDYHLTKGGT